MYELLYLLEWAIPDFGEIMGTVGTVVLIVGILNAFFGYKLFKTMLSIMGFLVGAVIGLMVFLGSESSGDSGTMWLYLLGGGFLGSVLADLFHSLGVFITVGGMGAIVALVLSQDTRTACIAGVICGIIGAAAEKYAIIVTSAMSGGSLVVTGLWLRSAAAGEYRESSWIGWAVCICGILFQLWLERRAPTESSGEESADSISWSDLLEAVRGIRPESVRQTALKSILLLPLVIGLVLGNLSDSAMLGCSFAVVMYLPLLVQFVRKYRAEARYGIPAPVTYSWEPWVNEVLIDNALLPLVLPGSFGLLCFVAPFALDWGDGATILSMLLGLVVFIAGFILLIVYLSKYRSQKTGAKTAVPVMSIPKPIEPEAAAAPAGACPQCGAPLRPSAVFCGVCGARVETPAPASKAYCGGCGAELPEGAAFCRQCGMAAAQVKK